MKCNQLIVGHCIESLIKSYSENKKIVLTSFDAPSFVDNFENPLLIEGQSYANISDAWSILRFLLSMRGLIVNPKDLFSVRIESSSLFFNNKKVNFKKCHLFPSAKTKVDLEIKTILNKELYRVLDIMRLPFCSVNNMKKMSIPDTFIDEVRFYGKKRIVCISKLTKNQLNSFDYSDTMSRIYTEKELLKQTELVRPLISPTRGMRKPKPVVLDRIVLPLEEVVYISTKRIKYYERTDRDNIIKTYRRNNTSCEITN